jgi:hypothetical protein
MKYTGRLAFDAHMLPLLKDNSGSPHAIPVIHGWMNPVRRFWERPLDANQEILAIRLGVEYRKGVVAYSRRISTE